MSSDLYELAKRLNLKKFSLAGHSMGGKTAMMFALSHPEMLECLVVMDIAPFTGKIRYDNAFSYHLGILNAVIETDISSASRREEVEIKLAGRIADVKVRGFIMKNLNRDESKKFKWKINTEALLKNLDKIVADLPYKYYSSDETTGFSVVFLKGENSDYIENEDIPEIKKLFPAAELRIIKNAGHWLNSDNPGAVITELKNCY